MLTIETLSARTLGTTTSRPSGLTVGINGWLCAEGSSVPTRTRTISAPTPVLARASEVLAALEKADGRPKAVDLADDLPLFKAAKPPSGFAEPSPLEQALAELSPDAMTPKQALEALYRLKALLAGER